MEVFNITKEQILQHFQGHRGLTRRTIEAFPEDKLFTFSIGGMRSFGEMCQELIMMGVPSYKGLATGKWTEFGKIEGAPLSKPASTKEEVIQLWDWSTDIITEYFNQITPERLQETDSAFGQWEGQVWWLLFYGFDNEIHHRGQAYVYLRELGIEPPHFWER